MASEKLYRNTLSAKIAQHMHKNYSAPSYPLQKFSAATKSVFAEKDNEESVTTGKERGNIYLRNENDIFTMRELAMRRSVSKSHKTGVSIHTGVRPSASSTFERVRPPFATGQKYFQMYLVTTQNSFSYFLYNFPKAVTFRLKCLGFDVDWLFFQPYSCYFDNFSLEGV